MKDNFFIDPKPKSNKKCKFVDYTKSLRTFKSSLLEYGWICVMMKYSKKRGIKVTHIYYPRSILLSGSLFFGSHLHVIHTVGAKFRKYFI